MAPTYVRDTLRLGVVWRPTRCSLVVFSLYNTLVCLLCGPLHVLGIPWPPVALLGTAACYTGFKRNGSCDRFWEGRQLRGNTVNPGRVWAIRAFDFVPAPAGTACSPSGGRWPWCRPSGTC